MEKVTSIAIAPYKASLEKALPSIRAVLPATIAKHLTPERMVKIALLAMGRNPGLLVCTVPSFMRCVMSAAELGLEVGGGALGHAYLVPFKRKDRETGKLVMEAQLIIGYRGYISLARRSGEIVSVESHVVHEHDVFSIRFGTSPEIQHTPCIIEDPGKPIGAYSVAVFKGDGRHVEFMTIAEINKIRSRSKAAESGPWVTDYEEMCRKTVVRRGSKYWPISIELSRAMDIEEHANSDDYADFDIEADVVSSPIDKGVAALKSKLREQTETEIKTDPNTGEVVSETQVVSAKDRAIEESEPGLFSGE